MSEYKEQPVDYNQPPKSEEVFADVFGGKFPVCNVEQKDKIEAAFKSAVAFTDGLPEGGIVKGCSCDLIIALLGESDDREARIVAATRIAQEMYAMKRTIDLFAQGLQAQFAAMPTKGGVN